MITILALALAVTAGWENISAARAEHPVEKVIWCADFAAKDTLTWEFREGALGVVKVKADGLYVAKTNDVGLIVVKGRPIAVTPGQGIRFHADAEIRQADVDYSSAFLRYHGKQESLKLDFETENLNFAQGGVQVQRGMPCTAPGMTFRKYAQCKAKDDVVTPVLVVAGARSVSIWRRWAAEDLDVANAAWKAFAKTLPVRIDHSSRVKAPAAVDTVDHTAQVVTRDGFARLLLDGEIVAPVIYKAAHVYKYWLDRGNCNFAGERLDGGPVKLVCVGSSDFPWRYEGPDGVDMAPILREVKKVAALAPNSQLIVGMDVQPPYDFISKHHPDEAWLDEKGQPVCGRSHSCVVGYNFKKEDKDVYMWPSFSSPAWQAWVKARIREYVAALKAAGLARRVVGVHLFGFHDAQMTVCYTDRSKCAQAEYLRMLAEPDCISTNYDYCMRLSAQRALNSFAREFKQAMGKPTIAVKWCESPFQGKRAASTDVTAFTRCDAIDVIVCQPTYSERFPGYPSVSALPMESLHAHGKLFLNELDLRTWLRPVDGSKDSFVSLKGISNLADLAMWQAAYRKFAGEAAARRMGYWFYDMKGGWIDDEGIASDICRVVGEERELARAKPSRWRPDVAVVIDEAQILQGENPLAKLVGTDQYLYGEQCRYLGTCGAPYESWLAQDVLEKPERLDGKKLVIFAFLRAIDARRAELVKRLSARGTTLVYLSEAGTRGGAEAIGFRPFVKKGNFAHDTMPEKGVTDNVAGGMAVSSMRAFGHEAHQVGPRCSVEETAGVKVLARYRSDNLPAIAERRDGPCRSVYVAEPSGLTPGLLNRLVRESGGYAAVSRAGLQIDMNGDFAAVHCLQPGVYDFTLPFPCRVVNMKTQTAEPVKNGVMTLTLTAGESCRFRLYPR